MNNNNNSTPYEVNSLRLNNNKSLLTLATNKGYCIYDIKTYTQLNKLDTNAFQISSILSLSIANVFYNSKYIIFVGDDSNKAFPPNHLVVWDDMLQQKSNLIILNQNICDFSYTKYHLFIYITNKILIFDFIAFQYLYTVTNILSNTHQVVSINPTNRNTILAKVGFECMNCIDLFIINNSQKTIASQQLIINEFDCIHDIKFESDNKLIVLSKFCNKIHIYIDIEGNHNYVLKVCCYLGNFIYNSVNFIFMKEKYLVFMFNNENIHIYKKQYNNGKAIKCNCVKYKDDKIKTFTRKKSNSLINGVKNKFTNVSEIYQKICYKYNYNLLLFKDEKLKKCFWIVNGMNGDSQMIKFGKKDKTLPKVIKQIKLFSN
jgi:hypothetical protein